MKIQTQIIEGDLTIQIVGEYVAAERGSRDRFGVPLEPDYDAYFDILDISIAGASVEIKDVARILDISIDNAEEEIQEALQSEYLSELEAYEDARAEQMIDNIRDYAYF
jgi:hypothetical protein